MTFDTDVSGLQVDISTVPTFNFDLPPHPLLVEGTVIYLGLWPIIVIFGIIGNILTLIVIFKNNDASTTSIYLKNLSIADLSTLSVKATCIACYWWQLYRPQQYLSWRVNVFAMATLAYFPEKVSKYITVAVVFERMVAVTWPFKVKDICTPKRTTIAIVVIYIFAISVSIPLSIDIFHHFYTSTIITFEYPSVLNEGDQYFVLRMSKSDVLLRLGQINRIVDLIPIPIILIGNIVIVMGLRNDNAIKSCSDTLRMQRTLQERKITKLCLTISISFLVLCTPQETYFLLYLTELMHITYTTHLLAKAGATLSMLNSSINFVIYAALNTKYRQGYLGILTCFRQKSEGQMSSQQVNTKESNTHKSK